MTWPVPLPPPEQREPDDELPQPPPANGGVTTTDGVSFVVVDGRWERVDGPPDPFAIRRHTRVWPVIDDAISRVRDGDAAPGTLSADLCHAVDRDDIALLEAACELALIALERPGRPEFAEAARALSKAAAYARSLHVEEMRGRPDVDGRRGLGGRSG